MPQPEPPPRRLTRSTTDRMIGGVAGGLGRHLGVDPLAVRITFVILSFAGGIGLIAYLLCLAFVPTDDPSAPACSRSRRWRSPRPTGSGARSCRCCSWRAPCSTCSSA
jgi:phage shock protein PspC (stress-responsive transcriptional regulator)